MLAILRIRVHMHTRGVCCNDFVVTQSMIEKINADMYCNKEGDPELELMIAESD